MITAFYFYLLTSLRLSPFFPAGPGAADGQGGYFQLQSQRWIRSPRLLLRPDSGNLLLLSGAISGHHLHHHAQKKTHVLCLQFNTTLPSHKRDRSVLSAIIHALFFLFHAFIIHRTNECYARKILYVLKENSI